jgi:glycosyltransferase involved in cell wall biosynthesis
MKILLVSYYFPPFNTVGAVRVGKMAKYLIEMGHTVKILTANHQPLPLGLPVEIDESHIIRTNWIDVNKPIQMLLGGKKKFIGKGYERAHRFSKVLQTLGRYYRDWINLPDGYIGWYPFALKKGKQLLKDWHPDFILASSGPPITLFVASKLAKFSSIPWVADLRDLWADNHNAEVYHSKARIALDRKLENYVLSTAKALMTVSAPLAETLKKNYHKPITVIANGYDLNDYADLQRHNHNKKLHIVHTGIINPIKRDPTPLFEALRLIDNYAEKIKIDFYGINTSLIKKMALDQGVSQAVHCYDTVPYKESLQLQVNADILLLITHNAPSEKGVITSKFFEYLGARRPILLIGCLDGIAAKIIQERQAGLTENDPAKIAAFLKNAINDLESKKTTELSLQQIQGFSRQEQTKLMIDFLESLLSIN